MNELLTVSNFHLSSHSAWFCISKISGLCFLDWVPLGTHLFIKVLRPEESKASDLFGHRIELPSVTTSLTTQS